MRLLRVGGPIEDKREGALGHPVAAYRPASLMLCLLASFSTGVKSFP